jgi:hypothetical protein
VNTSTRLIGTIAIGALLVAPAARAGGPDDNPGPRGPGAIAALQTGIARHPDNLAAARGPGAIAAGQATPAVTRPDDRGGPRGPGAVSASAVPATLPDSVDARRSFPLTPTVVAATETSFDWGDAIVGAVGGMGAVLLVFGSAFLLVNQRKRTRAAV